MNCLFFFTWTNGDTFHHIYMTAILGYFFVASICYLFFAVLNTVATCQLFRNTVLQWALVILLKDVL